MKRHIDHRCSTPPTQSATSYAIAMPSGVLAFWGVRQRG
jgi:hypothetical protein